MPSLLDNERLERFSVLSLINPRLLIAHTTYHGSVLLLYSISIHGKDGDEGNNDDDDDSRSWARVFEAARSLAEIFARIRGARGLRKVRGFVFPMVPDLHLFIRTSFYELATVATRHERRTRLRRIDQVCCHYNTPQIQVERQQQQRQRKGNPKLFAMSSFSTDLVGLYV